MNSLAFRAGIFDYAKKHIASYQHLLRSKRIGVTAITSEDDFKKLPIIDKASYLKKYPVRELFHSKKIPSLIYASSGSSGHPTFWFREESQEVVGAEIHERILRDVFQIKKNEPTLVVICFGMGIWIAGHYTFASFKHLAKHGYHLSIITPALEKEDTMRILAELSHEFKNVILVGYPPFVMDLVSETERRHIKFPKGLKILTSGDKFSEEWRDAIAERTGIKDPLHAIVGVYGSADTTVLGHETAFSTFIRRAAWKHPKFGQALYGDDSGLPGFVQYDPRHVFFEEIGGELVVTVATATPLIRYNLHDRGSVVSHDDIMVLLKKFDLAGAAKKYEGPEQFPFIILKGRTDVAVTFYALNIYPEYVKACTEVRGLQKSLSGNYLVYNKVFRRERDEKLFFKLELKQGIHATKKMVQEAARHALRRLLALSTEFRKLYADLGARALPRVELVEHGGLKLPLKARGMLALKGKKPRIVLS